MKISFRIETRFRFMYQQSYFPGDFSTYELKYVNKNFSTIMNVDYVPSFIQEWNFDSFRIECSIRNETWNELDPK